MPKQSYADTLSNISTALAELSKAKPTSSTYDDITALRDRLDKVLEKFMQCESCSKPFHDLAQIRWGDADVKVCTECGIAILSGEQPASSGKKSRRTRTTKSPKPDAITIDVSDSREAIAEPPVALNANTNGSAAPAKSETVVEETTPKNPLTPSRVSTSPARAPIKLKTPSQSNSITKNRTPNPKKNGSKAANSSGRGMNGNGGKSKPVTVQAEPLQVAKSLGIKTTEVKKVAGLMKELLPVMDFDPTVAYVSAELRNVRSKLSDGDISSIVKALSAKPKK